MIDMNKECRRIAEDTIDTLQGLEDDEAARREYFEDILDLKYIIDGFGRSYSGAVIAVTLGGPGVYVDTYAREVRVFWGAARYTADLPQSSADMIDSWFKELWGAE